MSNVTVSSRCNSGSGYQVSGDESSDLRTLGNLRQRIRVYVIPIYRSGSIRLDHRVGLYQHARGIVDHTIVNDLVDQKIAALSRFNKEVGRRRNSRIENWTKPEEESGSAF